VFVSPLLLDYVHSYVFFCDFVGVFLSSFSLNLWYSSLPPAFFLLLLSSLLLYSSFSSRERLLSPTPLFISLSLPLQSPSSFLNEFFQTTLIQHSY
jgi:hypothetical protein